MELQPLYGMSISRVSLRNFILDLGNLEMQVMHCGNGVHNYMIICPFVLTCPWNFLSFLSITLLHVDLRRLCQDKGDLRNKGTSYDVLPIWGKGRVRASTGSVLGQPEQGHLLLSPPNPPPPAGYHASCRHPDILRRLC